MQNEEQPATIAYEGDKLILTVDIKPVSTNIALSRNMIIEQIKLDENQTIQLLTLIHQILLNSVPGTSGNSMQNVIYSTADLTRVPIKFEVPGYKEGIKEFVVTNKNSNDKTKFTVQIELTHQRFITNQTKKLKLKPLLKIIKDILFIQVQHQ